ncbi:MAG: hypothetical protein KatS3mg111_2971 [Pirellulaceae bacterium]|nr:MAG: hypothetical protein KatS3mg111_2971 [Pirellulaceae bacterium]
MARDDMAASAIRSRGFAAVRTSVFVGGQGSGAMNGRTWNHGHGGAGRFGAGHLGTRFAAGNDWKFGATHPLG